MTSLYEAVGGTVGLERLARAWHERAVADEMVGHAFSHGFRPDHTERLAAYWAQALGGPDTYTRVYGDESAVVRMHSGNGQHAEMDTRAISCFDQALSDVGIEPGTALHRVLLEYWTYAVTHTVNRYPDSVDDVPGDLPMLRWDWGGSVPGTMPADG